MGTSMWINRLDPIESQGRECVQQIAYLVGIVVTGETPTTDWVTKKFRKKSYFTDESFLPVLIRDPLSRSHN